eukprot:6563124-Alexandrium_andersonii.AAC.1
MACWDHHLRATCPRVCRGAFVDDRLIWAGIRGPPLQDLQRALSENAVFEKVLGLQDNPDKRVAFATAPRLRKALPAAVGLDAVARFKLCLLYTSPSPRD